MVDSSCRWPRFAVAGPELAGSMGQSCHGAGRADRAPAPPPPSTIWRPTTTTTACPTAGTTPATPSGWPKAEHRLGPHFVRFECTQPGRPARLSRAFGIDGKQDRGDRPGALGPPEQHPGRRARGVDEPGLLIDFLGDRCSARLSRGVIRALDHTRCAIAGRGSPSGSPFRPAPRTRSCRSG